MYLGGGYKFGNYDYYGKGRYSKSLGKQTAGRESIINTLNVDDLEDEESSSEEDELDDFVNDLAGKVGSKIKKKSVYSLPMGVSDPYAFKNKDRAAGQLKNTGGANMFEYAGDHKNYIMKGFNPNLTYRSQKNINPSSQERHPVGSYIRNRPGRKSGTQYGTSRSHKLLTDIDDDNIFNLGDIKDPMEKAFTRQQNKIKKVLSIIKEYLL